MALPFGPKPVSSLKLYGVDKRGELGNETRRCCLSGGLKENCEEGRDMAGVECDSSIVFVFDIHKCNYRDVGCKMRVVGGIKRF